MGKVREGQIYKDKTRIFSEPFSLERWAKLAKRTQQYADSGDYRGFYNALKAVYGPTP